MPKIQFPSTVAEAIEAVRRRLAIEHPMILRARQTEYGLAPTDNERANLSDEEAVYEFIRPTVRRILIAEVRRRMQEEGLYLYDEREHQMLMGQKGRFYSRPFTSDCSDKHLAAMAV